jgi:hypothetical protein
MYTCNNFTIFQPQFNGNWSYGIALYTNLFCIANLTNLTVYGRDVYPINTNCSTIPVCSRYNYTSEKICTKNYSDPCKKYNYHYEKQCIRFNKYGICTSYNKLRINENCSIYREDLCKNYKTIKIKGNCTNYRNQTLCTTNSTTGCLDSITGLYTNQLSLSNFKISIDNNSWESIPYENNPKKINNSTIQFKLNIPNNCTPSYEINKAIYMIINKSNYSENISC